MLLLNNLSGNYLNTNFYSQWRIRTIWLAYAMQDQSLTGESECNSR